MISSREIVLETTNQESLQNKNKEARHDIENKNVIKEHENIKAKEKELDTNNEKLKEMDKDESHKEESQFTLKESSIKFEKIIETFVDWSKETGFYAYPRIFKDECHLAVRFIWLIVFLSFSGFTCFLFVQSILGYLQWKTVSTIEIVQESPTAFPALTICDSNPFASKYAQTLLETLAWQKFNINISLMNNTELNLFKDDLTNYAKIVVNDPDFGDANRKLLGFASLSSIVLQSKFDTNYAPFDSCFLWNWHANYGNCYQFNTIVNKSNYVLSSVSMQRSEGDFYGLYFK